jgi:hypothetical protein
MIRRDAAENRGFSQQNLSPLCGFLPSSPQRSVALADFEAGVRCTRAPAFFPYLVCAQLLGEILSVFINFEVQKRHLSGAAYDRAPKA